MKKIIILASERSGTNLLRTLLGNHNKLSAPVAPHFLDSFRGSISAYGDLNIKENAELLVTQMSRLANHKYNDWKLKAGATEIRERFGVYSLQTAFDALYTQKTIEDKKEHWVCKDNNMHLHAQMIQCLNHSEELKYLYLYRDPRDHIASWLRTPLYMHTPIEIAQRWVAEQKKIEELNNSYGIRIHPIKYEDLIADPEKVMTAAFEFLGLEIDPASFQTNAGNEESGRNELWKNLSKPIDKSNTKKYLKAFSPEDLLIVETICKSYMDKFGYSRETQADWVWKRFRGFGVKMKIRAFLSKRRNKELFHKTMADLQDKHRLLREIEREVRSKKNK
jgi:hypothetical protein